MKLCGICAGQGKTCCQSREIYITPDDVRRITNETGEKWFFKYAAPADLNYFDNSDDPEWAHYVFNPDASRRIIQNDEKGNCYFLSSEGCRLSLSARPLICRLHPFNFTAMGILQEPVHDCPVHLLPPGQNLIQALDMNIEDARSWHRMLYREIRLEEQL